MRRRLQEWQSLTAPRGQYWVVTQACLGDPGLRRTVQDLRPTWLSPVVPLLRVLDVAVWMWNSGSDAAKRARERRLEAG